MTTPGRLGTAVMKGMLKTIESVNSNLLKLQNESRHFILCVKSQESADRLRKEFAKYTGTNSKATNVPRCSIYRGRNVAAAQQAEPVIFGCQPQQLSRILSEDGMASALRNKLSISICAGFSGNAIRGMLGVDDESLYPVVHAMPNVCSTVGQSTTVITETVLGARHFALATWTFAGVGTTTVVSEPFDKRSRNHGRLHPGLFRTGVARTCGGCSAVWIGCGPSSGYGRSSNGKAPRTWSWTWPKIPRL